MNFLISQATNAVLGMDAMVAHILNPIWENSQWNEKKPYEIIILPYSRQMGRKYQ